MANTKTVALPRVVIGNVFNVYFESLYTEHRAGEITSCMVIADSARAAIIKAEQAFPGQLVNSIHGEDRCPSYGGGRASRPTGKHIVL